MIYLRTSVGIELRGDDLLISSLQSNVSGGVFSHFGRIAGYQLRDKRDVREEIDHFFKSKKLNKYGILLGIQRKDVILRYLNLPAEVKDNLKQVVRYQVQSFEPTEEDSFHYDYIQLPDNGTGKKLAVLLVMIKKAFLDSQLQLLRYFGIRPVAVTVNSIALANLFLHSRKDIHDKTYILADLTPSGIELLAVHHGSLAYSREINKEYGQGWGNLILSEVGEAAGKIRLGPNDVIEGIVLVGESSEAACQEIEASITDCQLLKSILPFEVLPENKAYIQEAASAIGLAFTGMVRHPPFKLNLLPAELRIHQTRWTYLPPIILGLTILALLIALGFRPMVQNRILIRKLDQEIQSLQASVNRVQSIQRRLKHSKRE